MEYIETYRCRKCGKVFEGEKVISGHTAAKKLLNDRRFSNWRGEGVHHCKDGYGMAEFIGVTQKRK